MYNSCRRFETIIQRTRQDEQVAEEVRARVNAWIFETVKRGGGGGVSGRLGGDESSFDPGAYRAAGYAIQMPQHKQYTVSSWRQTGVVGAGI